MKMTNKLKTVLVLVVGVYITGLLGNLVTQGGRRMKTSTLLVTLIFTLFGGPLAHGVGITFQAAPGQTLEDTILIASINGDPPHDALALGDFDLSVTEYVRDVSVDPATTHWWLIGHIGGNVVYSSNQNLSGVEMYSVEPYDISGASDWNIPVNLDGYVNGTSYSADWWAQTKLHHHSHVTADEGISDLWLFASPGTHFGYAAVSLHTNTPPDIPAVIPTPSAILLGSIGVGLVGWLRRRRTI